LRYAPIYHESPVVQLQTHRLVTFDVARRTMHLFISKSIDTWDPKTTAPKVRFPELLQLRSVVAIDVNSTPVLEE
jgi:hypothetical protein